MQVGSPFINDLWITFGFKQEVVDNPVDMCISRKFVRRTGDSLLFK